MRKLIFSRLSTDAALAALVPAARIFQDSAFGTEPGAASSVNKPFLIYRVLITTTDIIPARTVNVQVWAHDSPGSFLRIDAILAAVTRALTTTPAGAAGDGTSLLAIEWAGDSGDQYDPDLNTINRNATFRCVATRTG